MVRPGLAGGMEPRILVAGETLVDFLPDRAGPLADVASFERRPGGAPANVAVGLAHLDRTPYFWTRVGADPFGAFLTDWLTDADLPARFVERDPDAATSLAFVTREGADRSFTFYRDGTADTRLEPGRVPDDVVESVEWVVAGGVTLASGRSREATVDLLARAADATVAFDLNYRPEMWPSETAFRTTVSDAIDYVDVLKAATHELRLLGVSGDDPEALAHAVTERPDGPHTVLVTLGDAGALLVATARAPWGETVARHEGFEVATVDTTGAGDAFLAGTVAGFVDRRPPQETLAFANAVAALTTTEPGATAAFPDREQVATFLR